MRLDAFIDHDVFGSSFLSWPAVIYGNDGNWTKPDELAEKNTLFNNKSLTPDNHIKVLHIDGQKTTGRALLYKSDAATGYIGFIEFENDYSIFSAIMDFAKKWFAERGVKKIWGPIDIDTWHRYRLMTKGFEQDTFMSEPYNKPYYPEFFEKYGFMALEKYYSKRIDDPAAVLRRLLFKSGKLSGGYSVRKFRMNDFNNEMDILFRLSTAVFSENFAYSPIDKKEFMNLYGKLKPIMDADTILFGMAPDKKEAGFIFGYPEIKQIINTKSATMKAMGLLGLKTGLARPQVFNIKTLGVLKEHRATRLAAALCCEMYRDIIKKGYKTVNHCLIREGNLSGSFDAGHGVKNKEYCLYEYKL